MFPCTGSRFAQLELTVLPPAQAVATCIPLSPRDDGVPWRPGALALFCVTAANTHTILGRHRRQPAVTVVTSSSSLLEQDVSNEGGVSGIRVFRVYERAVCSRLSRGPAPPFPPP